MLGRPVGRAPGGNVFLSLAAVSLLTLILVDAPPASPQQPDPSSSSVIQYGELVPTASGPRAPGQRNETPIMPEDIGPSPRNAGPSSADPTTSQTLHSVASALGSVSEARLLGLLVVLGTITATGVALAVRLPRLNSH